MLNWLRQIIANVMPADTTLHQQDHEDIVDESVYETEEVTSVADYTAHSAMNYQTAIGNLIAGA